MKRIFCYDFGVAKKYKNNPPFRRMLIEIITMIISVILMVLFALIPNVESFVDNNYNLANSLMIFIVSILMCSLGFLFIDFFICCRKLIGQMTVFAIGENDEIYKVAKTNNVDKKMAVGYYIGDKIGGRDSSLSTVGLIMAYVLNIKQTKDISLGINNPDVLNEILKNPTQLADGAVYKLETIYDVIDKGNFYLIKCDYFNYEENKQYKNDEIILNKSYNCLDELVEILRKRIDKK